MKENLEEGLFDSFRVDAPLKQHSKEIPELSPIAQEFWNRHYQKYKTLYENEPFTLPQEQAEFFKGVPIEEILKELSNFNILEQIFKNEQIWYRIKPEN